MIVQAARYVRKAKKHFWCERCGCTIEDEYIRIFGANDAEEPKRYYYHVFCVPATEQAPVQEAIRRAWYGNIESAMG